MSLYGKASYMQGTKFWCCLMIRQLIFFLKGICLAAIDTKFDANYTIPKYVGTRIDTLVFELRGRTFMNRLEPQKTNFNHLCFLHKL